jgi:hypothetical protein
MIFESVEIPAPENTTIRRVAAISPAASSRLAVAVCLPRSIPVRVAVLL